MNYSPKGSKENEASCYGRTCIGRVFFEHRSFKYRELRRKDRDHRAPLLLSINAISTDTQEELKELTEGQ